MSSQNVLGIFYSTKDRNIEKETKSFVMGEKEMRGLGLLVGGQ